MSYLSSCCSLAFYLGNTRGCFLWARNTPWWSLRGPWVIHLATHNVYPSPRLWFTCVLCSSSLTAYPEVQLRLHCCHSCVSQCYLIKRCCKEATARFCKTLLAFSKGWGRVTWFWSKAALFNGLMPFPFEFCPAGSAVRRDPRHQSCVPEQMTSWEGEQCLRRQPLS